MSLLEKITKIVDEYCADHPDKILATVHLRNGQNISLDLDDFERIQDLLEES